jgi:hypothetical protein
MLVFLVCCEVVQLFRNKPTGCWPGMQFGTTVKCFLNYVIYTYFYVMANSCHILGKRKIDSSTLVRIQGYPIIFFVIAK